MITNAVPLARFVPDARRELTGRAFSLPSAKNASAPYVYREGPAPVPDGTKISLWSHWKDGSGMHRGWWVANTAKHSTWDTPQVFRLRSMPKQEPIAQVIAPTQLERITSALERIAAALEVRP